jgi:hypothetical protein
MKTAWSKIIFSVVISLFFMELDAAATQSPSRCDEKTLPAAVMKLLNHEFPQWRPKQLSDIDEEDRKLWLDGPNREACPGIAIGHFESAKSLSYAFLLVPKADPTGGHKIIVFSKRTEKNIYSWTLIDHAETQTFSGVVISKAKPGKYKDWEGAKSAEIKTDALYVEWIGKGSQLYYWSAGRYKKLQVSD